MPRKTDYKLNNGISSVDMLNAIRNSASSAYAEAVPIATADNLREVGRAIMGSEAYTNEFLENLLNRIGRTLLTAKSWNNPLKKYKLGLLEMGEIVQDIFVNSVEEKFYNMFNAEKEVFKVAIPDVRACYYQMNSQKVYKATINESMLAQAFLSIDGVQNLVQSIISRIAFQDECYEFEVMMQIIKNAYQKGMFYPVKLDNAPTTDATAKELVKFARAQYSKVKYPSIDYNYIGVKTVSYAEDIMLVIDSDLEALLDVEVLAKAFNMEKAEFLGHLTVIPKMPIENCHAIMIDKNWFKVWDNKITTQTIYNSEGLYYNYTFHHWSTFCNSPFENAIIFTSEPSAITSITLDSSAISALADTTVNIKATIEATGAGMKSAIFEVVSGNEFIKELTGDGLTCKVSIRPDAPVGSQIVVKAIAKYDTTKTANCTITVSSNL